MVVKAGWWLMPGGYMLPCCCQILKGFRASSGSAPLQCLTFLMYRIDYSKARWFAAPFLDNHGRGGFWPTPSTINHRTVP